uniref:Uncharacterized protein n=1 Tax=Cannabis sativa TaxID=3483 RepID=A0A803QXU6_CANSA
MSHHLWYGTIVEAMKLYKLEQFLVDKVKGCIVDSGVAKPFSPKVEYFSYRVQVLIVPLAFNKLAFL